MYNTSWPQASILCLNHDPGKAVPTELFQGKDAVDFVLVFMEPGISATAAILPVDKGAEYAVLSGVGLLQGVVVPDFFLKGEFRNDEFAGQGGLWWWAFIPDHQSGLFISDVSVQNDLILAY